MHCQDSKYLELMLEMSNLTCGRLGPLGMGEDKSPLFIYYLYLVSPEEEIPLVHTHSCKVAKFGVRVT